MAITVRGLRIETVSLTRNKDGQMEMSSTYALISSADKVLAKQGVNGYNDIKVDMSPDTISSLDRFCASLRRDISKVTGLDDDTLSPVAATKAAPVADVPDSSY